MGRKKGMTAEKVHVRNDKIFNDMNNGVSMKAILKKYGISEFTLKNLLRKQTREERKIIKNAVTQTDAEIMANATKHAAVPEVQKELPVIEPVKVEPKKTENLVGKMLIQIGDKMYEIGSVSLFKV